MADMTRYWIITLPKTSARKYNGLSFPHQFPDRRRRLTRGVVPMDVRIFSTGRDGYVQLQQAEPFSVIELSSVPKAISGYAS